jgi:hypothetical protein
MLYYCKDTRMIAMLDNNQDKMISFVEEWFEAMEKHSRLK